ncbi:hypothetical protein C8R46DRAFT_1044007 [Mycena filopes]|nr:hypothetical protein C8R46DRAFT_1044007 [Mycena filopes]
MAAPLWLVHLTMCVAILLALHRHEHYALTGTLAPAKVRKILHHIPDPARLNPGPQAKGIVPVSCKQAQVGAPHDNKLARTSLCCTQFGSEQTSSGTTFDV